MIITVNLVKIHHHTYFSYFLNCFTRGFFFFLIQCFKELTLGFPYNMLRFFKQEMNLTFRLIIYLFHQMVDIQKGHLLPYLEPPP